MEAWQEKRSSQTMNLRSVFTAEQQRILERYYENGMTNQSKSCFQLILQCAQETKLDFSVVRTWVGNKRRKLASKVDQNGAAGRGPGGHMMAGSGGAGAGAVLTPELAAVRGAQRGLHLLAPASSSASSPSSCSSHSSGSGTSNTPASVVGSNSNNNNNDVIVTGIYSLARSSGTGRPEPLHQAKAVGKAVPTHVDADPPTQVHVRAPVHTDGSPLHARVMTLPRRPPPQLTGPCGASAQLRKSFSPGESVSVSRTWAQHYGPPQPQTWSFPHSQAVPSSPAAASSSSHSSAPQPCPSDVGVRVQQVFSLAALGEGTPRPVLEGSLLRGLAKTKPSPDSSGCFSIAMETGDADDEYAREEELASMGAQIQICSVGGAGSSSSSSSGGGGHASFGSSVYPRMDSPGGSAVVRNSTALKPLSSDIYGGKSYQAQPAPSHCPPRQGSFLGSPGSRSSFPVRLQHQGPSQSVNSLQQAAGNLSAPWINSNSRKRTLQDRTQFSDRDLHALKRYWDNGMTSLGSVCREKISAAATELSVDSEIIKTWIGNRRRKYRLMGIEIPPPKGGPAVFSKQSNPESPRSLTPERDEVKTPELCDDSERNDEVSICLSEDGASDTMPREDDDDDEDDDEDAEGEANVALAENVKIEIIDDEEEDDDNGDMIGSDLDHMQNLLEFKQEEVRCLENKLENQKQKYYKLQIFTRNLLSAVRNMDQEKQQELLASLPQEVEEDWDLTSKREADPSIAMVAVHSSPSVSEEGDGTRAL